MPTGSSTGRRVWVLISASRSSAAPVSAEARSGGAEQLHKRSATCGATKATNPMGPAAETATAAKATAAASRSTCTPWTFCPKARAVSEPSKVAKSW